MFHLTPGDWEIATRLIVATFLGGLVGLEREQHGKDAGFRTYALVSLAASLIMVVSVQIYYSYKIPATDPSRIAAQVVSGIGFLGAGTIIRSSQGVRGLTTAAGIFAVAGIGLACGLGQYKPAIMTTVLALVIFVVFSRINELMLGKKYKKE